MKHNFNFLMLLGALFLSTQAVAADRDLSGTWASTEVEYLVLEQNGNQVTAAQRSPEIAAELGNNLFEGVLSGQVIKGRVATALPDQQRTFCAKNWANWVEFELTLSLDGTRLEGQWLQATQSTAKKGCPFKASAWVPWVLTRTTPVLPSGPTSKDYLIGLFSFLGLAAVFFFIRNAFVNFLVGSYKRSPNTAGLAGWGLFGGLLFASAIGSVALVSASYMNLPVIGSLAALSLICFVFCGILSTKK